MYIGNHGKYFWLQHSSLSLNFLLKRYPEFLLRKYLIVTSFDSGPLQPSNLEFNQGWLQHNDLAILPSVQSVDYLPRDQFDEWYIFSHTPLLEDFKVFVNDCSFSLRDPSFLMEGTDPTWDLVGIRENIERLKEMQELFWLQVKLKEVETYISTGNNLIVATQEESLYKRLIKSIEDSA